MPGSEERFIFPYWVSFVVKDRPSAPNPSRVHVRPIGNQRSWFGLHFLLNLPSKTVRIRERVLDSGSAARNEIRHMSLPGYCVEGRRMRLRVVDCALKCKEIVDDPRRGISEE